MDQEKIGKTIKEIRQKKKLSQQKFADLYGVTYQAVSKWENGKNMPDITILKQICEDNNIDLNTLLENKKQKKKIKPIIITFIIIILIITIIILIITGQNESFKFKTLSASCNNFKLYGSLAYNDSKSSIYISNITYCGGKDNNEYKKINCTLYEKNGKTKTKISSYTSKNKSYTLEEFLQNVKFHIDGYEKTCKVYKENTLELEIEATTNTNETISYKIPLTLEDNC